MTLERLCVVLLAWFAVAQGYPFFRDEIPNGNNVPHPCQDGVTWNGVGHFNAAGGGLRNPFGVDFFNAGKTWTRDLCHTDSDGDGRTNGQELGDPKCVWQKGSEPRKTHNITHPGVCEPINLPSCQEREFNMSLFRDQKEWMAEACRSDEFDCPGIKDDGVRTLDLRLDPTAVPARETTYICQMFEFPDVTRDYHMIASQPLLDNTNIIHHSVLYYCDDSDSSLSSVPAGPFVCGMTPHPSCVILVTGWTLGLAGDCLNPNTGIVMGKNGVKRFILQLHWNNPGQSDSYVDSSGLVLYYTPELRTYNASIFFTVGNKYFNIPPGSPSTVVTSTCSSSCTKSLLSDTVYVTNGLNHMHLLGRTMRVEQYRNGSLLRIIMEDPEYSFSNPVFHAFTEPLDLQPGDELKTFCEYDSSNRTRTTFYGPATTDEMCYAFLRLYPAEALLSRTPACVTEASLSTCTPETYNGCVGNVSAKYYGQIESLEIYQNITDKCLAFGPCTVECLNAILFARSLDPCLTSGDAWDQIIRYSLSLTLPGLNLLIRLSTCAREIYDLEHPANQGQPTKGEGQGGQGQTTNGQGQG